MFTIPYLIKYGTEKHLQEAIDCYKGKYGECTTVDNYIIYFIPNLAVMEMIWSLRFEFTYSTFWWIGSH